ncbi:MAG TPA: peptidylprolyl isomerase, partial [Bacteroidota bacterium]|nr:peptidylprolyl isomerase [Bacteroidota bacterium]
MRTRLFSFRWSLHFAVFSLFLGEGDIVSAQEQSILAKAGNAFITEEEFLLRFELTPGFSQRKKSQLEVDKFEFLYSLIAEKLLAQEAQDYRFDKDTAFQRSFAEVRKLIVRDELYRQEISQKVTVAAKEIQQGIERCLNERLVEFLFFSRKEDAMFVRSKIKNAKDIEKFQIDSSFEAMKDTATVIWGEANEVIEEAAYRLKSSEVSPVLQDGPGFYILWLKKSKKNSHYASLQPNILRDQVAGKIRLRKERSRLNEFVPMALRNDTAFARSHMVKKLSIEMANAMPGNAGRTFVFDLELQREIGGVLRSSLKDTVLVAGEKVWPVGAILDRLLSMKFEIVGGDTAKTFSHLSQQLRILAQQELLAREGLRRGLDKLYPVQKKLDIWYQAYLADLMKEYVKRTTDLSEAQVWVSLNSRDPSLKMPRVRL